MSPECEMDRRRQAAELVTLREDKNPQEVVKEA
jgi:hypothetical protein